MKKISLLSIFVLLVAALGWRFFSTRKKALVLPNYGAYLSCAGEALDSRVAYEGEIYFISSALPDEKEIREDLYRQLIINQSFYGFMNLAAQKPALLKSASLGHRAAVKILSEEEAAYPFSAEFETNFDLSFFPPRISEYLSKILPAGKIYTGAPARKVKFTFENDLQLCLQGKDKAILKELPVHLPKDPLMAYFVVPIRARISLSNRSITSRAIVNPCIDPFAIAGDRVAPFAFWYHWLPEKRGKDETGKSYDCTQIYTDKIVAKTVPQITEIEPRPVTFPDFKRLDNLERPIKATVAFGGRNNYHFKAFEEEAIAELVKYFLSKPVVKDVQTKVKSLSESYDSSLTTLLLMVWSISKHINLHSVESEIEPEGLIIYLRGKLLLSKKDIELKLFAARTLPDSPGAEIFNTHFAKAILEDDIVLYEGHSSYGSSLNGALEKARVLRDGMTSFPQYQLLGLFSCSSDFYYQGGRFPKYSDTFRRDIIRAGGGYMEGRSSPPLAIIASLDSFLYNESHIPFGLWWKTFQIDNFLILSNN